MSWDESVSPAAAATAVWGRLIDMKRADNDDDAGTATSSVTLWWGRDTGLLSTLPAAGCSGGLVFDVPRGRDTSINCAAGWITGRVTDVPWIMSFLRCAEDPSPSPTPGLPAPLTAAMPLSMLTVDTRVGTGSRVCWDWGRGRSGNSSACRYLASIPASLHIHHTYIDRWLAWQLLPRYYWIVTSYHGNSYLDSHVSLYTSTLVYLPFVNPTNSVICQNYKYYNCPLLKLIV